jgi:hypothetical protein
MTALAESSDVVAALGRALTAEEEARVDSLLVLASAAVSNEAGYRFAPGTYTIERRVRNGRVKIPATVASVTTVKAIDQCDGSETALALTTDYTRRGSTLYGISDCWVEVVFVVTADVPDVIVKLVASIVANTVVVGATAAVSTVQAGPFTTSYVDSNGRVWLSKSDKLILAPYKQPKPAIELA